MAYIVNLTWVGFVTLVGGRAGLAETGWPVGKNILVGGMSAGGLAAVD